MMEIDEREETFQTIMKECKSDYICRIHEIITNDC